MRYVWLTVAAVLVWLSGGDQPFAIAMLLAPVFLLRFMRESKGLRGYLIAWPVVGLAYFLAFQEATLGGKAAFAVSVLLGVALELLPYALDRWLGRRLPPLSGSLVFPTASVSVGFLLVVLGNATTGNVAYAFRNDLALIQLASVTGIWGIHFLVYWAASVISTFWGRGWRLDEVRAPVAAVTVVVIAVYMFGSARIALSGADEDAMWVSGLTTPKVHRDALFVAVHPLMEGRNLSAADEAAVRRVSRETAAALLAATRRQARAGAELVGWSETAVVCTSADEESIVADARALAAEEGIYLALGIGVADLEAMRRAPNEPFVRNKIVMVAPNGSVAWEYMKTHLVPGGLEGRTSIPGDGQLQFVDSPSGRLTGAVCYDLDYPDLVRPAGRAGAALMVAPSNDWPEIRNLHADVAQFRAVESGLSLLRPTSNGLSIAVDPLGRVTGRVDYFRGDSDALHAQLPTTPRPTLYSRIGDAFAWLCVLAVPVLIGLGVRTKTFGRAGEGAGTGDVATSEERQ